jgi:hypothetical protein
MNIGHGGSVEIGDYGKPQKSTDQNQPRKNTDEHGHNLNRRNERNGSVIESKR